MSNKPQIDPKLFSQDASNVLLQNIIAQSANEEETVEAQPAKADADKPNFDPNLDKPLGSLTPEEIKAEEEKALKQAQTDKEANVGIAFEGPIYGMGIDGVCREFKPNELGHPADQAPAPQKKALKRVAQSQEEFDEDIEKIWAEFDKNKNGQLEYKEFYDAVHKVFDEEHRELPGFKEVLGLMRQMDTDGNNKIDKNEFRAFLAKFKGTLGKH